MLSRLLDPANGKPRDRVFWLVLAAIAAAQLLALWVLCSDQVRKAEARKAPVQMQVGSSDCAQARGQSTLTGCVPAAATSQPVDLAWR